MTAIDSAIYGHLCDHLGTKTLTLDPVGGGSINKAFKISTTNRRLFCKVNSATKFPHLFNMEASGLSFLEKQGLIKTPKVLSVFKTHSHQALLLEWIEPAAATSSFFKRLGEQLAALHAVTQENFGLDTNNYMGAVPQANTPSKDWPSFFIHQRLEPLVQQCLMLRLLNSQHEALFQRLYQRIPAIFNPEPPALLHGDLWSGNLMCTTDQQPVLVDPAVYFGHRSIDLGMTTLFGGFEKAFYEAYHYHHPLPNNYQEQWAVCNLYPLLIHLLLFGKSYLSSIERTLNDFQ